MPTKTKTHDNFDVIKGILAMIFDKVVEMTGSEHVFITGDSSIIHNAVRELSVNPKFVKMFPSNLLFQQKTQHFWSEPLESYINAMFNSGHLSSISPDNLIMLKKKISKTFKKHDKKKFTEKEFELIKQMANTIFDKIVKTDLLQKIRHELTTELKYFEAIESLGAFAHSTSHGITRGHISEESGSSDINIYSRLSKQLMDEITEKFGVILPKDSLRSDDKHETITPEGKIYYWDWYNKMKKVWYQSILDSYVCSVCPFNLGVDKMLKIYGYIPCSATEYEIRDLRHPTICGLMSGHDGLDPEGVKTKMIEKGGPELWTKFLNKIKELGGNEDWEKFR